MVLINFNKQNAIRMKFFIRIAFCLLKPEFAETQFGRCFPLLIRIGKIIVSTTGEYFICMTPINEH